MHELRKAKYKELGVLHTIVGKKLGKWFCSAQAVRYQMKKSISSESDRALLFYFIKLEKIIGHKWENKN